MTNEFYSICLLILVLVLASLDWDDFTGMPSQ
jgi:hypothetical protein